MPDDDLPEESHGPLDDAAVMLHEMFSSLLRAGFTEQQALTVVGYSIAAGMGHSG